VHILRFAAAATAAILLSAPAYADSCSTRIDGCSGTWSRTNSSSQPRCYIILWAGGNGYKAFCLRQGESDTEQVRTGDSYCEAWDYTPNPNTCGPGPLVTDN
jgi:hypothetical protein